MLLASNSSTLFNVILIANKGLGKFEKAIEAYKKAISIKPDYAEAHTISAMPSKIRKARRSHRGL